MTAEVVILWRAPSPSSKEPEREILEGFSPDAYPGNGPYFATEYSIADDWSNHYRKGLQQIHLAKGAFDRLVTEGVVVADGYYPKGQSWHVPNEELSRFNKALEQALLHLYQPGI